MFLINCLIFCVVALVQSANDHTLTPPHCAARFELEVKRSDVMRLGKATLKCANVLAIPMHREGRAQFTGIDIFFAPQSADGHIPKSAKEFQQAQYVNLNLMTDGTGKVTQVNMSVVIPGKTVARTIAWKPEDLRKYFSKVILKDRRIVLKSSGAYDDPQTASEQASLHWDVDIDAPISNDR